MPSPCPICNANLFTENAGIPFINFRRVFKCDACGWQMDVDEVHKRGGLDNIKRELLNKHTQKDHQPISSAPYQPYSPKWKRKRNKGKVIAQRRRWKQRQRSKRRRF